MTETPNETDERRAEVAAKAYYESRHGKVAWNRITHLLRQSVMLDMIETAPDFPAWIKTPPENEA